MEPQEKCQSFEIDYGAELSLFSKQYPKLFQESNSIRTTRYTLLSWFPLSLLFQFRHAVNIYFLIITFLTCLSFSPKNPVVMLFTFPFVIFFSMLKEAYEDYGRYKRDKEINYQEVKRLNGGETSIFWENVKIGDILEINNNSEIPADIVILNSSNEDNKIFVDTKNLDGETSLKEKAPAILQPDFDILSSRFKLEYDDPNPNLSSWYGRILLPGAEGPIQCSIKNLLLRGSFLRNTEFCRGIVMYVGTNTKIMKNSRKTPLKNSELLRTMNKIFYLIVSFQAALIFLLSILSVTWMKEYGDYGGCILDILI